MPDPASCLDKVVALANTRVEVYRNNACPPKGRKNGDGDGTGAGHNGERIPPAPSDERRGLGVRGTIPTNAPTRAPIVQLVRGSVVLCDDNRRPWGKAPASPLAKTAGKQISVGIRADARPGAGGRWWRCP